MQQTVAIADRKRRLRRTMLARRCEEQAAAADLSLAVCERLGPVVASRPDGALAAYMAVGGEASVLPVLVRALASGREVLLPRWRGPGTEYEMVAVSGFGELVRGRGGIPEPSPDLAAVESDVLTRESTVWLVPGVAFDTEGRRLGQGGGVYDRWLASARGLTIGIAFDWQIVGTVPTGPHDVRVDLVVSDRRLLYAVETRSGATATKKVTNHG